MTLMMLMILAAILIVFVIYSIKKSSGKRGVSERPQNANTHQISSTDPTISPSNPTTKETNPHGSIPDKPGTRGDGDSALSAGGQG